MPGICRAAWANGKTPAARSAEKRWSSVMATSSNRMKSRRKENARRAPARSPVSGRSRRKFAPATARRTITRGCRDPWHLIRENERVWIIQFERGAFGRRPSPARFIRKSRAGSAGCLTLCLRPPRRPPRPCPRRSSRPMPAINVPVPSRLRLLCRCAGEQRCAEAFATPLGPVPLDQPVVQQVSFLPAVRFFDEAHALEHSLEVELPFLQQTLGHFTLVPLVVGNVSDEDLGQVINLLWGGP